MTSFVPLWHKAVVLSLFLSSLPYALSIEPFKALNVLNRRVVRQKKSSTIHETIEEGSSAGPKQRNDDVHVAYLSQPLDHFDSTPPPPKDARLVQRFFYTLRHVNDQVDTVLSRQDAEDRRNNDQGDESVNEKRNKDRILMDSTTPTYAFLCVGGEGPSLDESVLIDSVHCSGDMLELARILHEVSNGAIRHTRICMYVYVCVCVALCLFPLSSVMFRYTNPLYCYFRLYNTVQRDGTNVYLFALEHRYYGVSYPTFPVPYHGSKDSSPVSNDHLVWLSSRQAQQDLSKFVTFIMSSSSSLSLDIHVPPHTKWVTFGGSYPGFMAAWARQNFPHQIHAAVSSSAPIKIQVNFPGYKQHQGWDLIHRWNHLNDSDNNKNKKKASTECFDIVHKGHVQIEQALRQGRHEYVADLFGLCDADALLDSDNVDLFLGDGVLDIPAQDNDPSCPDVTCNIDAVCNMLVDYSVADDYSDAMEAVAAVANLQRQINNDNGNDDLFGDCVIVDWNGTLAYLSSDSAIQGGLRSWLWQTCTEVGYYQTCLSDTTTTTTTPSCPFGQGHHRLWMDYTICEVAFGLNRTVVNANVASTAQHYNGTILHDTGSRILSIQGDIDPWSVLSIAPPTNNNSSSMPVWSIIGASHHFWTHAVKPTDDVTIVEARNGIYETIQQWLEQEDEMEENEMEENEMEENEMEEARDRQLLRG